MSILKKHFSKTGTVLSKTQYAFRVVGKSQLIFLGALSLYIILIILEGMSEVARSPGNPNAGLGAMILALWIPIVVLLDIFFAMILFIVSLLTYSQKIKEAGILSSVENHSTETAKKNSIKSSWGYVIAAIGVPMCLFTLILGPSVLSALLTPKAVLLMGNTSLVKFLPMQEQGDVYIQLAHDSKNYSLCDNVSPSFRMDCYKGLDPNYSRTEDSEGNILFKHSAGYPPKKCVLDLYTNVSIEDLMMYRLDRTDAVPCGN